MRRYAKAICVSSLGFLANMAAGGSDMKIAIAMRHGGLALIAKHLLLPSTTARQHVARLLFALSSVEENKRAILEMPRLMGALVSCIRYASYHVVWHSCGAVANLALSAQGKRALRGEGAIPFLVQAAGGERARLQRQSSRALFALASDPEARLEIVREGWTAS